MLKLFYAKSTAALVPHILLEDANASYETHHLNFANGDQKSPEYIAINPKGRVPSLQTDRGILTETPAVIAYIAQTFPEAKLMPTDPFGFAQAQAFNVFLASTVHVAHSMKLRGARWSDDSAAHETLRAKVAENMTANGRLIEGHYFKGPWVLGDAYSICDPYLFLIGRWLEADGAGIVNFPKINAHYNAMLERPSVQTVLPLHS